MATKSWFFQANPEVYRIRDAVKALRKIHWTVRQHTAEIQKGDTVYIWESGANGGVLARGQITTELFEGGDPDELPFFNSPPEQLRTYGVDIAIEEVYETPLTRAELKAEPVLQNSQLIKSPQGTNFRISDEEASVLRQLLVKKPSFRDVVLRYCEEKVLFSSSERGSSYSITSVNESGCEVARLSAKASERVTFSLHDDRVRTLQNEGGLKERTFLDNTVVIGVTLMQSPELGLTADRGLVRTLSTESEAVELLCELLDNLNVNRNEGKPKLYKPALIAAVVEAIGDGEIADHRIHFDVILPRFLAKMRSLDVECGPEQAAMAFYHLTGDLFWNLAYFDINNRCEGGSITPAEIRQKISHAVLKEPFRWILRKQTIRQQVLDALAAHWWPNKTMEATSFWWVNQGQNFLLEKEAGVLWAPLLNKDQKTSFHWDNVGKVKVGDIVFHHANGAIVAVSICSAAGMKSSKPGELGGNSSEQGWLAKTNYAVLTKPIPLAENAKAIHKSGSDKYGPINKSGKANQGYLFSLTPAAARILAEIAPRDELPKDIATALNEILKKQWDAFVYWAKRLWEDPNTQEVERSYKLDVGAQLASAHQAMISGDDWYKILRRAFQGENNFTNYRCHDPVLKWCQDDPDGAKRMLEAIWNPDAKDGDAVADGIGLFPQEVLQGTGKRNNIVAFLALGRDATRCPIYNFVPLEDGCRLTAFPAFYSIPEGQHYAHELSFLDRIQAEAAPRGLKLDNRLDAQSVLWCVTKYAPPDTWSEKDRQAFLAFRAGEDQPGPETEDAPDKPKTSLEMLAEDLFLDVEFLQEIQKLLESKKQVIFYGPPGTGKTYVAKELARHLVSSGGEVEVVQFHPSYAYEDFVEGFRPRMNGDQPGFRLARGPLRRLAKKARNNSNSTFVLLIDEINRGNVAKIFGELYFLLEYRDEAISLQYSRKQFALPENLWVIGTMNTADRSIALIDAALRRRFYFVPYFPDESPIDNVLSRWLMVNKPEMAWVAHAVAVANKKLENRHGAIGPSYFMKDDLDEDWVQLIWKHAVLPYLAEQFFGDEERLKEFHLDTIRQSLSQNVAEL